MRTSALLFVLLALVLSACGATLDEGSGDSSNYNPTDFKKDEGPAPVTVVSEEKKDDGPRDPDGVLHRVPLTLHEYLAEVRLDGDSHVLVIFKGGDALKVKGEDVSRIKLIGVDDEKLLVRVYEQEYTMRRAAQ